MLNALIIASEANAGLVTKGAIGAALLLFGSGMYTDNAFFLNREPVAIVSNYDNHKQQQQTAQLKLSTRKQPVGGVFNKLIVALR